MNVFDLSRNLVDEYAALRAPLRLPSLRMNGTRAASDRFFTLSPPTWPSLASIGCGPEKTPVAFRPEATY
jgi:hypothetical protein